MFSFLKGNSHLPWSSSPGPLSQCNWSPDGFFYVPCLQNLSPPFSNYSVCVENERSRRLLAQAGFSPKEKSCQNHFFVFLRNKRELRDKQEKTYPTYPASLQFFSPPRPPLLIIFRGASVFCGVLLNSWRVTPASASGTLLLGSQL